jgi:hypothetical protein
MLEMDCEPLKNQGKIRRLRDNRTGGNANRSAPLSQCGILNRYPKGRFPGRRRPAIGHADCRRSDQLAIDKKQRQSLPTPGRNAGGAPQFRHLPVVAAQQDPFTTLSGANLQGLPGSAEDEFALLRQTDRYLTE